MAIEVVRKLVGGAWKTVVGASEDGGSQPSFVSELVTFDMPGLLGSTDPPDPGIRLGTTVVPAGSLVAASVVPTVAWVGLPFNITYPLLRSTDGLTSSALLDAGSSFTPTEGAGGFRASGDVERPWLTTEETHLGVGISATLTWGTLDAAIDDSQTSFAVDAAQDPPEVGVTIQIDDEQMTVEAPAPSGSHPRTFTVTRGVNGTAPASHLIDTPVEGVATAGETHIVFWILPLTGDLPS